MKPFSRLSHLLLFATVCTLVTLHSSSLKADGPPGRVALFQANAAVTATLTQVSGPLFSAAANGVVQNSLLGTCVEIVQLQVLFPASPDQPVLITGGGSFTALNGIDSLTFTVSGSALPDPDNPFFYNAKYQLTITGGTGAYASAKGQAAITEVVMFTSATTGTACWNMKGYVALPK